MLSFFKKAQLWLFPVFCSTPRGLEDVSQYPELFATLLASGMWTSEDLKKLAGLNFLRVFKEVERVSWSWGNDSSATALLLYKNNIIKKKPWLVVGWGCCSASASETEKTELCHQPQLPPREKYEKQRISVWYKRHWITTQTHTQHHSTLCSFPLPLHQPQRPQWPLRPEPKKH